jgi:2-keto-4-pentenoate hydratase/2-oxohepta-3-ene-1,7-dioic acid hydratase in catechol pathway
MTSTGLTAPFALARYRDGADARLGLVAGDRIRPLDADALGAADLNSFLAAPDWDRLASLASSEEGGWMPLADVTLTAPVQPRQVLQAGANYREHVIELVAAGLTQNSDRTPDEARAFAAKLMDDRKANGEPYFFIGLPACVVGDDVPLVLPSYSEVHDWELELAVVIGKHASNVAAADAMEYVAGYTMSNDISTRDVIERPGFPMTDLLMTKCASKYEANSPHNTNAGGAGGAGGAGSAGSATSEVAAKERAS